MKRFNNFKIYFIIVVLAIIVGGLISVVLRNYSKNSSQNSAIVNSSISTQSSLSEDNITAAGKNVNTTQASSISSSQVSIISNSGADGSIIELTEKIDSDLNIFDETSLGI